MNTNPKAKRILCYGDSLTYGKVPGENKRFGPKERWPGVVQDLLGRNYEIIEEGLRSRTTNLADPGSPGRNGLDYFLSCILSHLPLDYVIILLGSNDLKQKFNRGAEQIASALKDYLLPIEFACKYLEVSKPKLFLVCPPVVDEKFTPTDWNFVGAQKKRVNLNKPILRFLIK